MHPTKTTLSKIKNAAKKIAREQGHSYQATLERLTREAGFKNYSSLKATIAPAPTVINRPLFGQFKQTIAGLDDKLLNYREKLLIDSSDGFSVVYAPFDYINPKARVVLVGITPGDHQARVALQSVRQQLLALTATSEEELLVTAKRQASFSGPMRANLVAMLDAIGLHQKLHIHSCSALFAEASELCHFTSVLRYPVFLNGENYSGTPSPVGHPFLWKLVEDWFLQEIALLKGAYFVPLGTVPTEVLKRLCAQGVLSDHQVLSGLPHPSGANSERIKYFLGEKDRSTLSGKTNAALIDAAKQSLLHKLSTHTNEAKATIVTGASITSRPAPAEITIDSKDSEWVNADARYGNKRIMCDSLENAIHQIAIKMGFNVTPRRSDGTHQIELILPRSGKHTYVYVSRFIGLANDELQVVVSPELGYQLDTRLAQLTGVYAKPSNTQNGTRETQSSQYRGFANKGSTGEHYGFAYRLPIRTGGQLFEQFLETVKGLS